MKIMFIYHENKRDVLPGQLQNLKQYELVSDMYIFSRTSLSKVSNINFFVQKIFDCKLAFIFK